LSAWLLAISINLVSTGGFYDLAVRDVEIAIAAYVLANLTEVRDSARNSSSSGTRSLPESTRPVAAA
jgi:hypothetical protein